MDLTASKAFRYGGRKLAPGDDFTARSRAHAKVLQAIGRAKPREVTEQPVEGAEQPPEKLAAKPAGKPEKPRKGRYQRRDMRAED